MAFLHIRTSTKPAGVNWFGNQYANIIDELNEWTVSYPGVIGFKSSEGSNENEWKNITIFESREALDKWATDRALHDKVAIQDKYNSDNNITVVKTIKEV